MFKQITTVLLLIALSLQILNRVVVFADYYANTSEYAKNCENKALPVMHCNGRCQMIKKLKDQEKKESQLPERKTVDNEVIFSKSFFASLDNTSVDLTSSYNTYSCCQVVTRPRSHFHPPGAQRRSFLII